VQPKARYAADPFPNWPISPHEVGEFMLSGRRSVMKVGEGAGGTTGARKVTLHFAARDIALDFKWKEMIPPRWVDVLPFAPGMLDGVNNAPRKEIAAWKIQQIFLDEEDYVVPPSFAACAPLEQARKANPDARPTLEGSPCTLGLLSLWLLDVTLPDPLFDEERFRRDSVYAYYLANFNLLTYLVKHHDGRVGNFLVSKNDARRIVFAIDNGVSLGGPWYNWFVPNWNDLRVPALRKESVDRLRKVRYEDLEALLGVVAEMRPNEDGILVPVEPGPNLNDDRGVRYEKGTLQFGLTENEIEDVWERIEDLIEDVDDDDIPVF
jgi:hypothetical protein